MTTQPSTGERVAAVISGWEYECCGEPLFVGAIGDFTFVPWPDGARLPKLDDGLAVTSRLERHVIDGSPRHARARVIGLWEWRRPPEASRFEDAVYEQLTRMRIIDDWRPGTAADSPGWIVELYVIEELDPGDDEVPYDGIAAD